MRAALGRSVWTSSVIRRRDCTTRFLLTRGRAAGTVRRRSPFPLDLTGTRSRPRYARGRDLAHPLSQWAGACRPTGMDKHLDVVVVGGGYAGVMTANRLTERADVAVT